MTFRRDEMAVKIFVTVLALQEPEITQRCFGKDCGKGIIALVSHEDLGALMPCAQEICQFIDRQSDEPVWFDGYGREVYLRRMTKLTQQHG